MAAERRGTEGSAVVNVKGFRRLDGRYPPDTPPLSVLKAPVSPGRGFSFVYGGALSVATGTL
jgi:hypothetical protein